MNHGHEFMGIWGRTRREAVRIVWVRHGLKGARR